MNHSFNIHVATLIGVDESIILENICFWVEKNKANNKHFYDGETWTYNSVKAFTELFPYWSTRQIERILKSLEDQGLILVSNYNQSLYDRTKWYALTEKSKSIYANGEMEIRKKQNGITETVEPIPDINTNIITNDKTDINNTGVDPKKVIDLFHKICVSLPKVKELSDVRKKNIKKRFEGKTDEEIAEFFQIIEDSDFLCGRSSAWSANIDWILKAENFIKISENNYINKSGGGKKTAYEAKAEREFKEEEQWESSFGGDKSMQEFVKKAKEDWAKKKAGKV